MLLNYLLTKKWLGGIKKKHLKLNTESINKKAMPEKKTIY